MDGNRPKTSETTGSAKASAASSGAPKPSRKRRAVILLVTALVVIVALVIGGFAWAGHRQTGPAITAAQSGGATVKKDAKSPLQTKSDLPFSLDGVPTSGSTVEVSEGTSPASLQGSWTFGGDFSQIGSIPIDARTVFGSATTNPNRLDAYYAAFLNQDGSATNLESGGEAGQSAQQTGDTFYEPQDGTGDSSRVVWRSSTVNTMSQNNVDNWRLQTWDKASGKTTILGTAAKLNGRDDTPATYGEVVPTCNRSSVYFASNTVGNGSSGSDWQETILQYPLTGAAEDKSAESKSDAAGSGAETTTNTGKPRIIGAGNFPAATADGVLYAADAAQKGNFRAYATLKQDTGTAATASNSSTNGTKSSSSTSTTIFTVKSSGANTWGISGVWAHGSYRAVAFSDGTQKSGNYIGLWSDDFQKNLGWVHVKSASVVASMNNEWIVWGSGSQTDNAGMYAFNWAKSEVKYLGAVEGYSRPTIASDSNTVMVPQYDGSTQAVSFAVGTLN